MTIFKHKSQINNPSHSHNQHIEMHELLNVNKFKRVDFADHIFTLPLCVIKCNIPSTAMYIESYEDIIC